MTETKIVFVDGLEFVNAYGMALPWVNEIHITKEFEKKPFLNDIITHEKKHFNFYYKCKSSSGFKRFFIVQHNNIWNYYDSVRLLWKWRKYFKQRLIFGCMELLIIPCFVVYILFLT